MYSYLERLNAPQKEAATTIEGPLLVLAGAGTGKTSVITARIAYMVDQGIAPGSILGVTFTNKAAREMRERLNKLMPIETARKVTLGTFHSFCSLVLRRDIQNAGNYNSKFTICDESDQTSILRQTIAEMGYSKDQLPTDYAMSYIARSKNKLFWPDDAYADAQTSHPGDMVCAEVYENYQKKLELQNTVDFDDMLLLTLKIFETHPETLERYRGIYRYLLVDEYQDTNAAQFKILRMLAGDAMNICVVGDDDQSIYAWRGADVANILRFPEHFPGAKEVKLEQNYRSTNKILEAANKVIARNSERYSKNLWSAKGTGENLKIVRTNNGFDEAAFVVNTIRNLVARGEYNYSDFAILYRSNHLSRLFEQEFRKYGLRPRVVGGQEFFQRKEVKDAASYLKLIVNPRDDQSLLRVIGVPSRGIGPKAIETVRRLQSKYPQTPLLELMATDDYKADVSKAAANATSEFIGTIDRYREVFNGNPGLPEAVRGYLNDIGYLNGLQKIYRDRDEAEKRQENVFEFISYTGQYAMMFAEREGRSPNLVEFIENYSLMDDNDRTDDDMDRDAPVMSTVHASKGLEYPFVFIVGMEHNIFPHERALKENALEEERRLFYVAITRARENLVISYSRERFKYREFVRQFPSRFLADISEEIADRNAPDDFNMEAGDDAKRDAYAQILRMLKED